jgi:hypothetical protein
MRKKTRSQLSSAIRDLGVPPLSASEEKRKYVLEEVFWVPVSNCGPKRSTSNHSLDPCSERLSTSETAGSNDPATITTRRRVSDRDLD